MSKSASRRVTILRLDTRHMLAADMTWATVHRLATHWYTTDILIFQKYYLHRLCTFFKSSFSFFHNHKLPVDHQLPSQIRPCQKHAVLLKMASSPMENSPAMVSPAMSSPIVPPCQLKAPEINLFRRGGA